MARPDVSALREEAKNAVADSKPRLAVEIYRELEAAEPDEGGWPHRAGELLLKLGDADLARQTLSRAVETYARAGFVLKAVALCKLILRTWPDAADARSRLVDLNAERGIHITPRAPTVPPDQELPDPEPTGSSEIPLEVEMVAEPGLSDRARAALRASALTLALGPGGVDRLVDRAELIELAPREVLFRQGDPGETLYVVVAGEVRIMTEEPPRREIGRLDEGAFFGEIALVTSAPRSATVEAAGAPAELLALSRAAIDELCATEPAMLSVILEAVRERLVSLLAASSPLFRPFGGEHRRELVARFRCRDASAGAVLVAEGQRADGLYLLMSGVAEVVRGGEAPVAVLGAGDVFGEMSLLTGEGAVATVRAATRVLVLHLPAADFREVIMTHPQVLVIVDELAARRRERLDADDHVDLL
jgi:CRP-like cAMP-binding protein